MTDGRESNPRSLRLVARKEYQSSGAAVKEHNWIKVGCISPLGPSQNTPLGMTVSRMMLHNLMAP